VKHELEVVADTEVVNKNLPSLRELLVVSVAFLVVATVPALLRDPGSMTNTQFNDRRTLRETG
jgi:hypothetical protein